MNTIPTETRVRSTGNDLIRAACWDSSKKGKEAAESNRDVWGGWVFESESEPGFYAWFDSSYTPSEVMRHPFTRGHSGRVY